MAVSARTAVGLSAEAASAAVRAGISRLREHPTLTDQMLEPLRCAFDHTLDPSTTGVARLVALGSAALQELCAKMFAERPFDGTLAVLLATPEPRPGFAPEDARAVCQGIAAGGAPGVRAVTVESVGAGHAGGFQAMDEALRRLSTRQVDLFVVGAVDSYLHPDTIGWLDTQRRLARDDARGGFSPGEGAAMLALATRSACAALRLPALAQVSSVALGEERRSVDSDAGQLGEALAGAINRATEQLQPQRVSVDDVYCDVNGERQRSDDWGFMMLRVPPWLFRDATDYVTAVSNCGDLGAATGIFGCVLAVRAWLRGYSHGPRALVCGSSDAGGRGAALLQMGS